LFNNLQNDVEPLPEPLRTIFLILTLLGVLIIPILACTITMIRRSITKRRVKEMGSSWEDIDSRIPKTEDEMLDSLECIVFVVLMIFVGIVVVLMIIFGPIIRDIAVIILMGFAILFLIVICPLMMIWGVRLEDRRNAERIKLARQEREMRESGSSVIDDSVEKEDG
jgi:MFS family permease